MLYKDPINKAQPEESELWALALLEAAADGYRFRVDGLRPDVLAQRPTGFDHSMVDVISALRRGEQQFVQLLQQGIREDAPSLSTTFIEQPRAYVNNPMDELGALLTAREDALMVLRRLSSKQWLRTINDPERGSVSLRQITLERARHDQQQLDLLEDMRYALLGSIRPGIRTLEGNLVPDSTR